MSMSAASGRTVRAASNAILIVVGVLFLVPMIWVVSASFDGSASLAVGWPKIFTLNNFGAVLTPDLVVALGATTWALYAEVSPVRVLPVVAAALVVAGPCGVHAQNCASRYVTLETNGGSPGRRQMRRGADSPAGRQPRPRRAA